MQNQHKVKYSILLSFFNFFQNFELVRLFMRTSADTSLIEHTLDVIGVILPPTRSLFKEWKPALNLRNGRAGGELHTDIKNCCAVHKPSMSVRVDFKGAGNFVLHYIAELALSWNTRF